MIISNWHLIWPTLVSGYGFFFWLTDRSRKVHEGFVMFRRCEDARRAPCIYDTSPVDRGGAAFVWCPARLDSGTIRAFYMSWSDLTPCKVSVGLEHISDIIADFEGALNIVMKEDRLAKL